MTLYVYCLSDVAAAHMLEEAAGVGGARPRLIQCGVISAVVSDFAGESVSITRENVFAHERVIERVLGHTTPLPFRFGTLVSTERLKTYVAANLDLLVKSLEHVRDCVEMSVKIIWNAEEVRYAEASAEQGSEKKEVEHTVLGKGAAYLDARRREILGDELLKARAEEIGAWLTERVGNSACDRDVRVRPTESLVIRAAFLIRRAQLHDYQERVETARMTRADLRFLTSGPWPPYSFSNINA